jgi:hypothetical protein
LDWGTLFSLRPPIIGGGGHSTSDLFGLIGVVGLTTV